MINKDLLLEDRILEVITEAYKVPLDDIIRRVRKKEIVEPRQVIAYCLRLIADMSFPKIGEILGGRDHTTIMHSCSKIASKIENNERFRSKMEVILNAIREPENNDKELSEELQVDQDISEQPLETTEEPLLNEAQTHYSIPEKNLELSEREKDILEKYRGGATLEEIGMVIGVTRERVRQIAFKSMMKIVGAKARDGFEMDVAEFLKGEKMAHDASRTHSRNSVPETEKEAMRTNYTSKASSYTSVQKFASDVGIALNKLIYSFPEIVEVIQNKRKEKQDRWSWYYAKCRGCGTTTIPHLRKGYCEKCIGVHRGERRKALLGNEAACAVCSINRKEALLKYRKDMFITRDGQILCRGCFLQLTGNKLAQSRRDRI